MSKNIILIKTYTVLEWITEILIYFMVIFPPWAFGATEKWAIWICNIVAYLLGSALIFKKTICRITGYQPLRWDNEKTDSTFLSVKLLFWSSSILLVYCFISAINSKAFYIPETYEYVQRNNYLKWLPHSADSRQSWFYCFEYLGLYFIFWGLRDWLLGKTKKEKEFSLLNSVQTNYAQMEYFPTQRLRKLLWIIVINGAVLALVSIIQRLDGTHYLLWIVRGKINSFSDLIYGPFAYKTNAAQYFNLIWPIALSLWYLLKTEADYPYYNKVKADKHLIVLPCLVLIAACPTISSSRGGAIVSYIGFLAVLIIFNKNIRHFKWGAFLPVITLITIILIFAGFLGGENLLHRMLKLVVEKNNPRLVIYENAEKISRDYLIWGSGPGTFATLYQWYRNDFKEAWETQVHDDFLETRITFGWVGYLLIVLCVASLFASITETGKIFAPNVFVSLLSLSLILCFIHAKFDFPFQVHSIINQFLISCAIFSTLSKRSA